MNACSKDVDNFGDTNILIENEEFYEISSNRPFEAWLMTPSLKTRAQDSEVAGLIEYEKAIFNERFSFVKKFFKLDLVPLWESAKAVPYNEEQMDIFVPCDNIYSVNYLINKIVLVISKRGSHVSSFIKILPKDEYLGVSLTTVEDGDRLYVESTEVGEDGMVISQSIGYFTNELVEEQIKTRAINCENFFEETYIKVSEITDLGDGRREYIIHDLRYDSDMTLVCDDFGGGSGVATPPPANGSGTIPGYTPPSHGSDGNNDSGDIGNDGGDTNNGGDLGNGAGNPPNNGGGSNIEGGTSGPGGGYVEGGNGSDNSMPQFPEDGGINIIPRPENGDEPKTLVDDPIIGKQSLGPKLYPTLLASIKNFREEHDYHQKVHNKLVARGAKFWFYLHQSPSESSAPASYDSSEKSIKFKNESTISVENLREELFHGLQDYFYEGGIAQYGKDSKGKKLPGYANIEFETKVFKDLAGVGGAISAFFKYETAEEQNAYDKYDEWIKSVRLDPSILKDKAQYNYWLDLFIELNPYYESPKSNDFSSFDCLFDLITKNAL